MASTVKILSSTSKKHPLGEVLVLISQQGQEILSSLHFVMLCLYLRGHLTFGCYFFTRWVLLHRPFNIWRQLGQKCLSRGLASIEVGWPQLLWILNLWQKSAVHAKFGHYRMSGSWVMSSVLQKTSNARPPFITIEDWLSFSFSSNVMFFKQFVFFKWKYFQINFY